MKKKYEWWGFHRRALKKMMLMTKLTTFLVLIFSVNVVASVYSQNTKLNLNMEQTSIKEVLQQIESQSDFRFIYENEKVNMDKKVSILVDNESVDQVLNKLFEGEGVSYTITSSKLIIIKPSNGLSTNQNVAQQQRTISGRVNDSSGQPLPGVTVLIKGTTQGTVTDFDGTYTIADVPTDATLVFSFVGMKSQEILVGTQSTINVVMVEDAIGIEEVVAIGYGTMKKSDLTGSVVRADIESFRESANVSILSSLQGSVPGLVVGQTTSAGQQASLLIRGQSTISGETRPLIVLDGVIFRGNLVDINPNDIASVDVLKDASAAAIYGSQATNGVIIFTTLRGKGSEGKPIINFTSSYSFQAPTKKMIATGDEYFEMMNAKEYMDSRTQASGYTEPIPTWDPTRYMVSNEESDAYEAGLTTNWYDLVTNDNMYLQNYNVSISNSSKYTDFMASAGYADQAGYMANNNFSRVNARINFDTRITDWLTIGAQSFMTSSDYSGNSPGASQRYFDPYAPSHDADGNRYMTVGLANNPLNIIEEDNLDKRLNFFANTYAEVKIPFVKGLTYKVNFSNNYLTNSDYNFRKTPANSFKGSASKNEGIRYDWSIDNVISYKRTLAEDHKVDVTLVTGMEEIKFNSTNASSSIFASDQLGYNRLQAGDATQQTVSSNAWEESSLYSMMRLFYSYKSRYLFTGTVRRDGFSGFSEENKFGVFPSASLAWILSDESFFNKPNWLEYLKLRASYGSVGNRTIGRYATLARVAAGYNYITYDGTSEYTQSISSLASPNLKWETTTGINLGLDFSILKSRITGNVEYYNNNTTNLLYNVDIPSITRFSTFPDNLGELNNNGLEFRVNSVNIKKPDFEWTSSVNFSRDRNKLVSLLGFDNNNDGVEDDLVSEGLFIGKSIDAIYTYKIDGIWQLDDQVPVGYEVGSYKTVDLNEDGEYSPDDDRTIIGNRNPSYRFSISNNFRYKNWNLYFFINSSQGGKDYYFGQDYIFWANGAVDQFRKIGIPEGFDYWSPSNRDAFYQRPGSNSSDGLAGLRYTQRNFVRLQDISLSYSFPQILLTRIKVKNLKLYFSGKNLLTLTKWNGWDPETGESVTQNGLPVTKSYTFGIDLKF